MIPDPFDDLVKSRFFEVIHNGNYPSVSLDNIMTQDSNVEPIDHPELERFITLSIHGKGAKQRMISEGKTPVKFSGYRVKSGQFIYSRIDARNGAFGIIPDSLKNAVVSKDFPVYDLNTELIQSDFLMCSLLQESFIDQVQNSSFGATNRQRIKEDEFAKYSIVLPPIDVQKEFSSFVQKVAYSKSIYQQIVSYFDNLVRSRFIEMFKDFEMCPLSEYVGSFSSGKSLAGSEECDNKVLNTGSVTFGYFNPKDVKNLPVDYIPNSDHQVRKGDLLVSRMNTPALVGAVAYVNVDVENTYIPDRLWKAHYKSNSNPIYLWQALQSENAKRQITSSATGTSGTMKNITKENMMSIMIPKASLELQNSFACFFEQVDKSKFDILSHIANIKGLENITSLR